MECTSYDEITSLIEESDRVDFAPYGEGVSEEWIQKAERRLGLPLPPSYKWWLKHYGGGEIGGEEIYSIYEREFENVSGGDIVYVAIVNERAGISSKEKLYVSKPGSDEAFYFDTTQSDSEGEYRVFVDDHTDASSVPYASNFLEFLKKRIEFFHPLDKRGRNRSETEI